MQGKNHDIKTANISSENVTQLKNLVIAVSNPNLTKEEIKRSLNPGNACYL
jgi:hypothetical protein